MQINLLTFSYKCTDGVDLVSIQNSGISLPYKTYPEFKVFNGGLNKMQTFNATLSM